MRMIDGVKQSHVRTDGLVSEIVYEPGNGTRYHLLAVAAPSGWGVVISVPDFHASMVVAPGSQPDAGYVQEKMRLRNRPDAEAIATAIAALVSP